MEDASSSTGMLATPRTVEEEEEEEEEEEDERARRVAGCAVKAETEEEVVSSAARLRDVDSLIVSVVLYYRGGSVGWR